MAYKCFPDICINHFVEKLDMQLLNLYKKLTNIKTISFAPITLVMQ